MSWDGRAPALTERSAAVRDYAARWAATLLADGRVAAAAGELTSLLAPLTVRMAAFVRTGEAERGLGRDVAFTLMGRGYAGTEVIGPTIGLLLEEFIGFEPHFDDWPDATLVRHRLTVLGAGLAAGFAETTRDQALAAQEQMQRAALAAVRTAEAEKRLSQARFSALFAQSAAGMGLTGLDGRVIDANPAWASMMGYSVEDIRGMTIADVIAPGGSPAAFEQLQELIAGKRDHFRMEITHDNARRERYVLDLAVSLVRERDGEPDFIVGVAIDITERRRLEDRLWHEARHDPLTGLPNRRLFLDRLAAALADKEAHVGVCYVDLDGFRSVNEGLGHDVGDGLLVAVAGRLRACVRRPVLLARLGGDEFGVLIERCADPAEPRRVADQVLAALAAPVDVGGREVSVSASVGVVDTSSVEREAGALLRAADISLYRAKSRGRGRWREHDPDAAAHEISRHALSTEIAPAMARGEFVLEYQPIVQLADGAMHRVEALLRWRHPTLGMLGPDEFVHTAEDNGQIVALGRWVLETACAQARQWQLAYPSAGIGVNVNVAVAQLHDPDLPDHVTAVLTRTGLPPTLLCLELVESSVLGEGPASTLRALAATGVRLVIDDFGTGYSNLLHLSRLPAAELKIAGSFLGPEAASDPATLKIVPAIISLAHSLGLAVTAEGVQDAAQAERLRVMDCDTAQGWFFSPPLAAAEVGRLLSDFRLA